MSQNLKDSLAIFNKKIPDISISIVKLEKLGLSPSSIIASLIMIIMGFGTYYMAPLAFLTQNYGFFLFLLNVLLIIMIIGMVFMLQIIVPYIERIFLEILMMIFRFDRNIKFIVIKNLEGHYIRNQKTSIMFMISLSFIIFAGCTLELVSGFIKNSSEMFFGANIWIWQNDGTDTLNQILLNQHLIKFNNTYPNIIHDFTFLPYPLNEQIGKRTTYSNMAETLKFRTQTYAFEENFLNSVFLSGYSYSELNSKKEFKNLNSLEVNSRYKKDIFSGLYIDKNQENINFAESDIDYYSIKRYNNPTYPLLNSNEIKYNKTILLICAEGLRNKYSFSTNRNIRMTIEKNPSRSYNAQIIGMAIKIPGYIQFSSYSTLADDSPMVMSLNQFKEIIDLESSIDSELKSRLDQQSAKSKTFDNIRRKYLFIKFKTNATLNLRELLYFELKNLLDSDNTQIVFVDTLISDVETSSQLLGYIFLVIGIIALILSFFLILTSFYSNIRDNICEFGIMRSIGVDKNKSIRIYLYEAFVIILSAILVGTGIGLMVSTTLVIQFNLFLELPFNLAFPIRLYLVMCILGIIFALVGSYIPTENVTKLPLFKILKGLID